MLLPIPVPVENSVSVRLYFRVSATESGAGQEKVGGRHAPFLARGLVHFAAEIVDLTDKRVLEKSNSAADERKTSRKSWPVSSIRTWNKRRSKVRRIICWISGDTGFCVAFVGTARVHPREREDYPERSRQ